jgi:predicted CoA-binding protein
MNDWRRNILETRDEMRRLLAETRRIAVLGIRSERFADRPAFYVARYMAEAGYEVVPVPVYEPEVTEILGQPVYRSISEVPGEIDMVDVFRRAEDIPRHVNDILAEARSRSGFNWGSGTTPQPRSSPERASR